MWWILACTEPKNETTVDTDTVIDWRDLDPRVAGPFAVGHTQIVHTYTPIEGEPERTIPMEIWYPTTDTTGTPAEYFLGMDELVFHDASVAPPIYAQGYPVHVSSHGYRGWGANSAFLMRHFASHGWVVVAPNHINNTLADHQSPLPISHFIHRPKDITESLNVLESLEWEYPIDTEQVVLSGHSFGASYSTWASSGASYDNIEAVCWEGVGLEDPTTPCTEAQYAEFTSGLLQDPRVTVSIPMAGTDRKTFFGEEGYKQVHAPVFYISGSADNLEASEAQFQDLQDIDFRWLNIDGACHQSFTVGGCPSMDTDLAYDILNYYILAYARQRLLQDDSADIDALLSGQVQPWTESVLQLKE